MIGIVYERHLEPLPFQAARLSKVLERLVHDKLQEFLTDKLDVHQHGFIKHKSTLTNLTHYIYISRNLDASYEVHAVDTDFSKAFDTVNFDIL